MLQLWTIALVGVMALYEALPGPTAPPVFSIWMLALSLAPFLVIMAMVRLVCRASVRALDARGDVSAIAWADRTVRLSQPLAVGAFAAAVLGLGLIGQLRAILPGVPLLDYALAILPPLSVFINNWAAMYPIERRLSDASMMRALDDAQAVYAPPTRGQYVLSRVRHELLLILVPLVLIGVWSRGVDLAIGSAWMVRAWPGAGDPGTRSLVQSAAQMAGVVLVLALAPAVMRRVWDTVRLGEGALRDELLAMCRGAGVRVREILVWRTHHVVVNAAAMGLVPRFRYILLTDGLLERLPRSQLHAVMAHEIGHVKHRHIPWLIMGVVASGGLITALAMLGLWGMDLALGTLVPGFASTEHAPPAWRSLWLGASNIAAAVLGLGAALGIFGCISRRFEWQADAFAAQRLSVEGGADVVTSAAAGAMQGALQTVAELGHVPTGRFSFRHGSILTRQRRLQRLVGTSVQRAPIDQTSGRIKVATALGLAVVVAMSVLDALVLRSDEAEPRSTIAQPAAVEHHS